MTYELYRKLFFDALRIRLIEEKIIELYPSDQIQSPVHLSIGQEAIAVGYAHGLCKDDWMFINYRGHAFYLAMDAPLPNLFAELMGRVDGLSKGKGGSMHLAAPEHGIMGASAVVGSTVSHAVGAALAAKIKGEKRIFTAIIGDGATEQGVIHEALNFASLHQLPVLFLCEDNGLAVHTSKDERQSFDLSKLVEAYGVPFMNLEEGYDLLAVERVSARAKKIVRNGEGPVFLRIKTFRYREHVGPGEDFHAGYRSLAEIVAWRKNDPLVQDTDLVVEFTPLIAKEIEEALAWASNSPFPSREELLTDV